MVEILYTLISCWKFSTGWDPFHSNTKENLKVFWILNAGVQLALIIPYGISKLYQLSHSCFDYVYFPGRNHQARQGTSISASCFPAATLLSFRKPSDSLRRNNNGQESKLLELSLEGQDSVGCCQEVNQASGFAKNDGCQRLNSATFPNTGWLGSSLRI